MQAKCFLAILVLFALIGTASAAEYYLDAENGNDSWLGTSEQPWKTIQRAQLDVTSTPHVVGGDTVYLRGGNYGKWGWQTVNNTSGNWVTYKAEDINNPPIFTYIRLNVYSSTPLDAYLIFDGLRFEMTGLTQPELNAPWAFASYSLSHIKVKNCNFEAGLNWRTNDHTIRGQCVNIRGKPGKGFATDIEVSDCNMTNSQDGLVAYMIDGGLFTRNNMHHLGNDAIQCADITNTVISNNTIYDLDILGDKSNVDGNNTLANGPFLIGETITQTHNVDVNYFDPGKGAWHNVPAGTYTATIRGIFDNYYYIDITDKSVYGGGFVAGYLVTGLTSGATMMPTAAGVDGYHSDVLQIYSSEEGTTDNITVSGNRFHDAYQGFLFEGTYLCDGLLIENNLWYGRFYANVCSIVGKTHSATIRNNTWCQDTTNRVSDIIIHSSQAGAVYEIHNNLFCRYFSVSYGGGSVQTVNESNNIASDYGFTGTGAPTISPTDYIYHKNTYPLTVPEMTALFTDYANHDFTLKSTAKAVNFGDAAYAPATDILGNSRDSQPDAGAYEFQETSQQQPCTEAQLLNYISQWKTGSLGMAVLMQKIAAWKAGTGC